MVVEDESCRTPSSTLPCLKVKGVLAALRSHVATLAMLKQHSRKQGYLLYDVAVNLLGELSGSGIWTSLPVPTAGDSPLAVLWLCVRGQLW